MKHQLAELGLVEDSPLKRERISLKLFQLWQNHNSDLKFWENGPASLQD